MVRDTTGSEQHAAAAAGAASALPWARPLAAALLCLCGLNGCKEENQLVTPPPPQVSVAQPLQRPVTPYLEATGSAQAHLTADIVARVGGVLNSVEYADGAEAKRGDLLFVIDPVEYQARLQQAQSAVDATQAQLIQSDSELRRQSTLARQDWASQSTIEQARAQRDGLRANLVNQQAGVTLANISLGYTRVTAPFDGLVTAHLVSPGNLVGISGPTKLATIVQLDPIYVNFNISEQDALRIRANLARRGATIRDLGTIPVEVGLMDEEGYPHQGSLDYAAPAIDTASGTLAVRGILPNPGRRLLPGNFLRIRIPLGQPQTALLIPDQALGTDQGGRYALVVNGDNTVEQRSVRTGPLIGSLRVIESGLGAEDRVVVGRLQRAIPGSRVAPQPAQISPGTASAALASP
jgi:membrane fusion protein, multidrug efflux system